MKKKRPIVIGALVIGGLLFLALVMGTLFYNGIITFNHPSKEDYPVRGVDVASYQGEIDWVILSKQDIQFAFIKATEGSTFVDGNFERNYTNAIQTDLRVGAYHFFSFDSAGSTQAENFINTVPAYEDMLPPVVDVEFYGKYVSSPPSNVDDVKRELRTLLEALEAEYGRVPIIYATHESYNLFLKKDFEKYDIWIRDIFTCPTLSDAREWTFWQYTNRGHMEGYQGVEKFIDINVFAGTVEEFENYGREN